MPLSREVMANERLLLPGLVFARAGAGTSKLHGMKDYQKHEFSTFSTSGDESRAQVSLAAASLAFFILSPW